MTDLELLDILGSVKNEYILQAQDLRANGLAPQPRRSRKPLLALLTAALALATVLAASLWLR